MKKFRKTMIGIIAAAAAALVFTGAAFAFDWTGTVAVSTTLNVRQSYTAQSAIIGRLYNGNKVNIIGNYNGWYKISYNGTSGWVSGAYVSLADRQSRIQTIVNTANSALGVKYVFGAASPTTGFDCSGLTQYAYAKAGLTIVHSAARQATLGTWVSRSNLKPGDLVFFDTDGGLNNITHCGIYIGNNMFIQAESGSVQKVAAASLTNRYWSGVYMTARRIII